MSKFKVKAMIRLSLYAIVEAKDEEEARELAEELGIIWENPSIQGAYFVEGDEIYEVTKEE